MSKSRRDRRGFTREQSLQAENEKLKRTIAQLRKQIARAKLCDSANVRDIVRKHYAQEDAERHAELERESLENMKKEWQCNCCETGHLEIVLIGKVNGTYYFRACTDCTNRTKLQPYNKNVRGIVKK